MELGALSRYYVDGVTGTWGRVEDLIGFNTEPPEDFDDWTDTERAEYALDARIGEMFGRAPRLPEGRS